MRGVSSALALLSATVAVASAVHHSTSHRAILAARQVSGDVAAQCGQCTEFVSLTTACTQTSTSATDASFGVCVCADNIFTALSGCLDCASSYPAFATLEGAAQQIASGCSAAGFSVPGSLMDQAAQSLASDSAVPPAATSTDGAEAASSTDSAEAAVSTDGAEASDTAASSQALIAPTTLARASSAAAASSAIPTRISSAASDAASASRGASASSSASAVAVKSDAAGRSTVASVGVTVVALVAGVSLF